MTIQFSRSIDRLLSDEVRHRHAEKRGGHNDSVAHGLDGGVHLCSIGSRSGDALMSENDRG